MSAPTSHGSLTIHCPVCEKKLLMAELLQEEDWYSPQPGVPYQPLIAMPQQIIDIQPMLVNCEIAFFSGYDPPRTLVPAIAMAPVITTNTPQNTPPAPTPSPTQDPGPRETLLSDRTVLGLVTSPTPTNTQTSSILDWAPG